jgi:F0F1-type ATP synthase delta subunit
MTRKEALIQILTLLVNHWDLAKDFLLLLQKSNDEQLFEKIYSFLKKEIKKLKGTQQ